MRVLFIVAVISVISACAIPPCRGRLSPVNGQVNPPVSAPASAAVHPATPTVPRPQAAP
jgi:hypothetical protein